jgi:acyl-CoA thioesterase FadM
MRNRDGRSPRIRRQDAGPCPAERKHEGKMKEVKIRIPQPEGQTCFACGTGNPIGLKLKFYRSDDAVCTDITLGKYYEGWANMAHGGIISTLLDETMSWTILYLKRAFFVTRKMEIKYIRPVLVEKPLTVRGKLLEPSDDLKIRAKAEIRDGEGNMLARSTGEFVVLPKDQLSLVPEEMKKEMVALFEQFPPLEEHAA